MGAPAIQYDKPSEPTQPQAQERALTPEEKREALRRAIAWADEGQSPVTEADIEAMEGEWE